MGNIAGRPEPADNKLCYTGIMEGLVDCGETINARYIIFNVLTENTRLSLAELLAWDEPMIEIDISSI